MYLGLGVAIALGNGESRLIIALDARTERPSLAGGVSYPPDSALGHSPFRNSGRLGLGAGRQERRAGMEAPGCD